MKKKIIGLSILLLVLLLGLSTTCYADINRTWTENNIKNAIYNYRYSKGQSDAQIESYLNTNASYITAVTNAFNSYNYVTILYQTSDSLSNMAFLVTNTNGKWYLNGNRLYTTSREDSKNWIFPASGTAWQNNGWLDNFFNLNYYYTSKDIYENQNSNTIKLHANSSIPTNLITSPYEDRLPFSFVSESGLGTVTYNNYEYTLFEKPSSGDLLLGQLYIPNGIIVNYQDVLNFYWRWNNWHVREFSSDSIRLQFVSNNDGDLTFNVYLNNQDIYINTYYLYTWSDHTSEPYQFTDGGCYIKDSHTVIVNGVVDPFLTFSGDYADEYNNELENMDFQQNLQDQTDQLLDSSEVDGLLAGFSSSGDILDAFGYSPIENPFVVVIKNIFQGLNDVLLGSGNQTLDLSSFGLQLVLHSEDFVLPNNIITTFIHLICNGFFVYGLYKYGFQLIQWINTGRLQNLLDETSGSTNYLF